MVNQMNPSLKYANGRFTSKFRILNKLILFIKTQEIMIFLYRIITTTSNAFILMNHIMVFRDTTQYHFLRAIKYFI